VLCAGATGIRPEPIFPQPGYWDVRAFYSNYGASALSLAGPGGDLGPDYPFGFDFNYLVWGTSVEVNATDPPCWETANCPVGYIASGGTSAAAPHVAGVAALVIDAIYGATGVKPSPDEVRDILLHTAEPIDLPELGAGMVDANAALGGAVGTP
jgi:subtilisin family serine protease